MADSGPTATGGRAGVTDASPDRGAPLALTATRCGELDLPPVSAPLEAVGAVTLTASRLYLGRPDGLYAFERQGGCAGARVTAFEADETRLGVLALAPGIDDSVLVARRDGLVLIGSDGQRLGDCASGTITNVSTRVDAGEGIAVQATRSLLAVSFDAQGCSSTPLLAFDSPPYAILAVAADPTNSTSVVGLERTLGAPPTLARVPTVAQDATGPCSISGLAVADASVVVLDPACSAVRFIDVEANAEPLRFDLPAPLVGRAVAAVPESQGMEIVLGAVDPTDAKPSLWVISKPAP